MKQQKAMLIALIVICLTVIVTALVTRKDLCEVRIRTGCETEFIFVGLDLHPRLSQSADRRACGKIL